MANSYEDRSWTKGQFTSFQGGLFKFSPQPNTDMLACGYWERFLTTTTTPVIPYYPWMASLTQPNANDYTVWIQPGETGWVISDIMPDAASYTIWIQPL